MPLSPYAIITDPDEVWEYLDVEEPDRVKHARLMETWINMGTAKIEKYVNRPVVQRLLENEKHDGNGRNVMYTNHSPISRVHSLQILTRQLDDPTDIDVSDDTTQADIHLPSGRITLLIDANIGSFLRGSGNVRISYTVGFDQYELDVFKQALIELVAIRWEERGRNPLERNRTDIVEGTNAFQKSRPDQLPFEVATLINAYRRVDI